MSALDIVLRCTFFRDHAAQAKQEAETSLRGLIPKLRDTSAREKAALPWLKLATFGQARTKRGSLRHDDNLLIVYGVEADYDGESITVDRARQVLTQAGIAAIIYTSPSHSAEAPRWRVLCPFSRPLPPGERARMVARLNGLFVGALAAESFTASQAYYYGKIAGNDAHQVAAIEGRAIDEADELDAHAVGRPERVKPQRDDAGPTPRPATISDADGTPYGLAGLSRECQAIRSAPPGRKWETINRAAYSVGGLVGANQLHEGAAYAALRDAVYALRNQCDDFDHALNTLKVGFEDGLNDPRQPPPPRTARGAPGDFMPPEPPPLDEAPAHWGGRPASHADTQNAPVRWQDGWQRDPRSGTARSNLWNAMHALRHDPGLRDALGFDEWQRAVMLLRPIRGDGARTPRPIVDLDVTVIQERLQAAGLSSITRETVNSAVDLRASENAYNPVLDHLTGLTWDGTVRLPTWLPRYLGTDANDYTAAIGAMTLVALVARAFEPGCKSDYMLVLEGKQGAEKSKACAVLAGEWFSDALPDLRGDQVRVSQHLRGKWLVEIAELSAFGKAETEDLKAFVTRTVERFTPKYAKREVIEPRTCIFVGTTNEESYLRDHTGSRRFWPVRVGHVDITGLKRDRDQLLAEAVARYQSGEPWWPDRSFEERHIQPQQEARREVDPWEEPIREWLKSGHARITVNGTAKGALGIEEKHLRTPEQRRISAILKGLDWEQRPSNGVRWWRPKASAEVTQ